MYKTHNIKKMNPKEQAKGKYSQHWDAAWRQHFLPRWDGVYTLSSLLEASAPSHQASHISVSAYVCVQNYRALEVCVHPGAPRVLQGFDDHRHKHPVRSGSPRKDSRETLTVFTDGSWEASCRAEVLSHCQSGLSHKTG